MTKAGSQMISNLFGTPAKVAPPTKDEKVWQVSEILSQAKRTLEKQFHHVAIVGEISAFKPWRSGHWYFNLKDKNCSLNAIMFRNANQRVPFEVEEGQEVLARGRISVYPERSQVQFIVDKLEPVGEGALALAFEQMKAKLQKEGLFDPEAKKELPEFPLTIGLVTSPQGAALRDMLRVMGQRWAGLQIRLAPTRVQGKGAAQEIAQALNRLDEYGDCDVIVLSRGGGSLADLWAFNEEVLARAIFAADTPVVSAVGHATDTTIADFVSDLSVATPTHAASILKDKNEFELALKRHKQQLNIQMNQLLQQLRHQLQLQRQQLVDPRLSLLAAKQVLDDKERRAQKALLRQIKTSQELLSQQERQLRGHHPYQVLNNQKDSLAQYYRKLVSYAPRSSIKEQQQTLHLLRQKLDQSIRNQLALAKQKVALQAAGLDTLSPLKVLSRGYALVHKNEELVSTVAQVKLKDEITLQFSDGAAQATITKISPRKDES